MPFDIVGGFNSIVAVIVLLITIVIAHLCRTKTVKGGCEGYADGGYCGGGEPFANSKLMRPVTLKSEQYGGKQFTFDGVNERPLFVIYHMKWCHFCKLAMPEFDKLYNDKSVTQLVKSGKLDLVKIDCELDPEHAQRHGVDSYPTIVWYATKHDFFTSAPGVKYQNERTVNTFRKFLLSK